MFGTRTWSDMFWPTLLDCTTDSIPRLPRAVLSPMPESIRSYASGRMCQRDRTKVANGFYLRGVEGSGAHDNFLSRGDGVGGGYERQIWFSALYVSLMTDAPPRPLANSTLLNTGRPPCVPLVPSLVT